MLVYKRDYMKKLTKNFVIISFFTALSMAGMACGKTTEKTTTIIKEADAPKEESGIQFKLKTKGISVETGSH